MIRHRPAGSGHPYVPDTEQRWPVQPVAGEPLRLGVRTSGEVEEVVLELEETTPEPSLTIPELVEGSESAGEPGGAEDDPSTPRQARGEPSSGIVGADSATVRTLHPLVAVPRSSRGQAVDGGHLASAQARQARQAGGWEVHLPQAPTGTLRYRFTATRPDGRTEHTRWFEVRTARWRSADPGVLGVVGDAVAVVPGSIGVLDDGERVHRVRFALPLAPSEHLAGFGERYDALDHRGTTLDSMVFEQYKNQGAHRRTYLPMPFAHVVGGAGWGFHVRTSRRVWFDLGATDPTRLVVEAEVDAPTGQREALSLALYSGDPTTVLDAFLADVGRPRELPEWVFRLWASGNEWNTQAEVERQLALHRQHDIPVGNVVIEAWSDESSFTIFRDARYTVREDGGPMKLADFSFPADGAWPDPKGMVDRCHAQDVRVHLWQIPLIKMRPHPAGQAAADARAAVREGVLVREDAPDGRLRPYRNRGWWFPLGLMPDLTDERAATWWTEKRRYLVEEVGVDGFKTDGGEHAWGAELAYSDGTRGDAGNNLFPVAYAAAYGRLLESAGKAPVTFSRAGFTGSQAHGAFWAGDENSTWEAFRWSMFAGLSAAASGLVYWGWDIAGFSGPPPDAELYLRAMAASVFVPIMQYHSEFNHHRLPARDRTPWNIAELTGDDGVIGETRELVKLRERLIPYLAEQTRQTLQTGRPLMRSLYFDYPDDRAVWDHPLQWTLGDAILVAPVVEPGAETWPVYLPAGEWVDAWTAEPLSGARIVHSRTATRSRVPVFVHRDHWNKLREVFTA